MELTHAGGISHPIARGGTPHPHEATQETTLYWEKAMRVSTGTTVLVPAHFVYWNYLPKKDIAEPLLRQPNSNGGGGHFTRDAAICSALYELVERDAFLMHWLLKAAPPKIIPKSVPDDAFQEIIRDTERYGFEIHCLNTTLDTGIPSFISVLMDASGKGSAVALGGGCGADPVRALKKAVLESWGVYHWLKPQPPYTLAPNYQPFYDHALGQEERGRLWANPDMTTHLQFLLRGNEKKFSEVTFGYPDAFPSAAGELQEAIKRVEGLGEGYEVYAHVVQHAILKKLGYFVAKTIVPKLVPLYLRENYAPVGAERLQEMKKRFWLDPKSELNTLPHPFA